jgi:hypothetical protein
LFLIDRGKLNTLEAKRFSLDFREQNLCFEQCDDCDKKGKFMGGGVKLISYFGKQCVNENA